MSSELGLIFWGGKLPGDSEKSGVAQDDMLMITIVVFALILLSKYTQHLLAGLSLLVIIYNILLLLIERLWHKLTLITRDH